MVRLQKRPTLLLEVLIALAIIALAIFPLLAPQAYILKDQKKTQLAYSAEEALDAILGDIVVSLYRGERSLLDVETARSFDLNEWGLPWKGEVSARIEKKKLGKPASYYLVKIDAAAVDETGVQRAHKSLTINLEGPPQ